MLNVSSARSVLTAGAQSLRTWPFMMLLSVAANLSAKRSVLLSPSGKVMPIGLDLAKCVSIGKPHGVAYVTYPSAGDAVA